MERPSKPFFITEKNVGYYAKEIPLWIKTYAEHAHMNGVVLGMSSGLDCCAVAAACAAAGVPVHLILMPYGPSMTNTTSHQHAMEFINKFGFVEERNPNRIKELKYTYQIIDIQPGVDGIVLASEIKDQAGNINPELLKLAISNISPRVRMTTEYLIAQTLGYGVIGTGNMSERTVGYFTKHGDGGCDFNPLGYLTKSDEIPMLARIWGVPECIIIKKPSAELYAGQTDEAELGVTYVNIDRFIKRDSTLEPEIAKLVEHKYIITDHKRKLPPMFGDNLAA